MVTEQIETTEGSQSNGDVLVEVNTVSYTHLTLPTKA
mgnify:CR=1 FL=1